MDFPKFIYQVMISTPIWKISILQRGLLAFVPTESGFMNNDALAVVNV